MIDYSVLSLEADNYFFVWQGRCRYCSSGSSGCDDCQGTGYASPHEADLSTLLHNLSIAGALATAARDAAADLEQARRDVLLQAARLRALESEVTTLKASIVDALSSAGPEVGEDERTT